MLVVVVALIAEQQQTVMMAEPLLEPSLPSRLHPLLIGKPLQPEGEVHHNYLPLTLFGAVAHLKGVQQFLTLLFRHPAPHLQDHLRHRQKSKQPQLGGISPWIKDQLVLLVMMLLIYLAFFSLFIYLYINERVPLSSTAGNNLQVYSSCSTKEISRKNTAGDELKSGKLKLMR
jgi:hypothetical protein